MRLKQLHTRWIPLACAALSLSSGFTMAETPVAFNSIQPVTADASFTVQRELEFDRLSEDVRRFELQNSLLRRAVQLALPSIVHIEAIKDASSEAQLTSSGKPDNRKIEEAGAGVLVEINANQYVITNRHVVHAAELRSIRIETSDRSRLNSLRMWSDPSTDIAVIAVEGDAFVASKLGDSDEVLQGDSVFAIGSPFGLNHSVTSGILSAKGRRNLDLGNRAIDIQDFFQTDAAINPGNSGGPLFNLRGEVIGINTAIASNSGGNEGIGFSIPINMVISVVNQLVKNGQLQRAYLGVQMDNSFDVTKARQFGLQRPTGALVKAVRLQSPAETAGFRYGDIILFFNGVKIQDDGHLVQTVGLSPIHSPIKAIILRQNQRMEISVTLQELPNVY